MEPGSILVRAKWCPCGVTLPTGQSLCYECGDRLWQELYWLADMYESLFKALTHRLNVEKAEQVKVKGAKDPMVQGLALNDDAVELRHRIRNISVAGIQWLRQRNPGFPTMTFEVKPRLQFTARNLHWILSDWDPGRIDHWAAQVVEARLAAEALVTPQTELGQRIKVKGRLCSEKQEKLDGSIVVCGGELYIWSTDASVGECSNNPAHLVSRETLLREQSKLASEDRVRALVQAILKEP